jgi:hypothetical protein
MARSLTRDVITTVMAVTRRLPLQPEAGHVRLLATIGSSIARSAIGTVLILLVPPFPNLDMGRLIILQDDGTPMMSCGLCSKWQHIACHDRADQQAGRRRRNWDVVEFFCLKCRAHRAGVTLPNAGDSSKGLGASTSRGAGAVHPAMSMGASQLDQTPFLGHAYDGAGGTLYGGVNSNSYMGTGNQSAPRPAVNGSNRSYAPEQHFSNVRSVPSMPGPGVHPRQHQHEQHVPQHQSHPPQQQPYGATTTIAFSHYQPQQRGFSSSPLQQQQHNASGHTQPYGHHASTSSGHYGQYSMSNGIGQSYQVCYFLP